jgi:3',5'-cyclic AMP phosphodiesterase CpdA
MFIVGKGTDSLGRRGKPRPEAAIRAPPGMIARVADASNPGPSLLAVSDLHVGFPENRPFVSSLTPKSPDDWLIVAGDVGEFVEDIEWVLGLLSERFAKVIWVPGNHELWSHRLDTISLRGTERYEYLVALCGRLGVITPEDAFPVWPAGESDGVPTVVAPLFLLYDYTFRPDGATTKAEGLAMAQAQGVVGSDEFMLHPDPFPTIEEWCAARIEQTERRLAALPEGTPTVLVNHFPLVREPTRVLRYPEFAQWCGTVRTADWPQRFNATAVVYGHLHIPRTTWHDGIRHEEVSLGYPREWQVRAKPPQLPRQIL